MGMSMPVGFHTREMVLAMPDDGLRHETVWGELLVTPSPTPMHQFVVEALSFRLAPYARSHALGRLVSGPADLSWGPDILVQPDLFVMAPEHSSIRAWSEVSRLLLVIEVISPSSARADRFAKRRLYQEHGVPHYWAVDPAARHVEAWTPDSDFPVIHDDQVTWHPSGASEPLVIVVGELFR